MALTWQVAGTVSVDAVSPMTINTPGGVSAGNLIIAVIGMKPSVASSGSVTTPAGWTLLGSHVGGGYGATLGADTGNTHLFVFYQVVVTPLPSVDFTLTNANSVWGQMFRITSPVNSYDLAMAVGEDTAAGSVSITFTSNPGVSSNDIVVGCMCIPTDVTTPAQFSAPSFSQTGVTFSAATEITEYDSATGNDIGGVGIWASVTAGLGSANPVMTITAGGTTTNVRGPGVFIRIREAATSSSPISGSSAGVATVAGTLRGRGKLSGSIQGVATVTGTLSSTAGPTGNLAGSSFGVATVTGSLRAWGKLSGSAAGVSTSSGSLKGKGALRGESIGTCTVIGILRGTGHLIGITAGTSSVSGQMVQPGLATSVRGVRLSLTNRLKI